jgi:hypothetical protein
MMETNHRSEDRVTISLGIESVELRSSDVTDRLGSPPDWEWSIGEARGKTGKHWECNGWNLETVVRSEDTNGRPAVELVHIAMQRFEERVRPIAGAVRELGGSASVTVVISILADVTPGIECGHSFLELLSNLGGTFQIDL